MSNVFYIISFVPLRDKDLTLIMIAHRLSSLKDCDRILYFHNKEIEQLSYEEMIEKLNILNKK